MWAWAARISESPPSVDHEGDAHRLDGLVDPGVREDVALVAGVGLAAVGLAGFEEVVEAAVALAGSDVGALAVGDAVGDPVDDQRFGARAPEWAIDRVLRGVDHVQAILWRRGFDANLQSGDVSLGATGASQFEHVLAGRGEACRGHWSRGLGEHNIAGAGDLRPSSGVFRQILQPHGLARKIGLPTQNDRAVDARVHDRSQGRRSSGVGDHPLQEAGCVRSFGSDFETKLLGGHRVEARGVERVGRNPETVSICDRNEIAAIPVKNSVRGGRGDPGKLAAWRSVRARRIDCPVNVYFADRNRFAPGVLHPRSNVSRFFVLTDRVTAVLAIKGTRRSKAVIQSGDLVLAGRHETGRNGNAGKVQNGSVGLLSECLRPLNSGYDRAACDARQKFSSIDCRRCSLRAKFSVTVFFHHESNIL